MNDNKKKHIAIVICVFFSGVSAIIVGLLICFGVLSTPEAEHNGSNALEYWEDGPIAYESLSPPSNFSSTGIVPLQSSMYDVIIIGAGMAGLSAALKLCESEKRVLMLEANVRFYIVFPYDRK